MGIFTQRLLYRAFLTLVSVMVLGLGEVRGQAILMNNTGNYSQDFNSLINSGSATWTDNLTIANWYAQRTGSAVTIVADAGATNSGNLYSYGTALTSERALGSIGSGNALAGNFAWGTLLRNTSGGPITDIRISYTGEQWRNGGGSDNEAETVSFHYIISSTQVTALQPNTTTGWTNVPALNFTSPIFSGTTGGALDGNAVANRVLFSNVSIPALTLNDNDYILLKWDDPNHTGNDHGFSIDDIIISWTACSVPLIQANNIISTATTSNSIALQWNNGTGLNRIVKMNIINSFTDPVNGTTYPANPVYSGSGEQVVYNGSDNNINISGLNPLTSYCFRVYEYNCIGSSSIYLLSSGINNPTCITTVSSSCTPSFTTIAFQGGELADSWPYSSSGFTSLNSTNPRSGSYSFSLGAGGLNGIQDVSILELGNIDISCYSAVSLSFYTRTNSGAGSGLDCGTTSWDDVQIESSLNNGAWTNVGVIRGGADYTWGWTTNPIQCPASCGSALTGCGNAYPNPFTYSPSGSNNLLRFRILFSKNRIDEILFFDDITLSGTTICGPSFTLQPSDQAVCEGNNASFTIDAAGTGSITYQWQIFSGGTWVDLSNGGGYSGVGTQMLSINPATSVMSGSQYQCIASTSCGVPATSLAAILTVNMLPLVTATSNSPICQDNTLILTGGPNLMSSYSWTGPGFTSGVQSPSIPNATTIMSGTYTVTATGANGCINSASANVVVNALPTTSAIYHQ